MAVRHVRGHDDIAAALLVVEHGSGVLAGGVLVNPIRIFFVKDFHLELAFGNVTGFVRCLRHHERAADRERVVGQTVGSV